MKADPQRQNTGPGTTGRVLRRFLYPDFPIRELPRMAGLALLGAVLAGAYGVAHDQITYTISPEYSSYLGGVLGSVLAVVFLARARQRRVACLSQ